MDACVTICLSTCVSFALPYPPGLVYFTDLDGECLSPFPRDTAASYNSKQIMLNIFQMFMSLFLEFFVKKLFSTEMLFTKSTKLSLER